MIRSAKQAGKSYDEYVADQKHASAPSTAATSTNDLSNGLNEKTADKREDHEIDLEKGVIEKKDGIKP